MKGLQSIWTLYVDLLKYYKLCVSFVSTTGQYWLQLHHLWCFVTMMSRKVKRPLPEPVLSSLY